MSPLGKAVTDLKALRGAIDHATGKLKGKTTDPTVARFHLEVLIAAAEGIISDAQVALEAPK